MPLLAVLAATSSAHAADSAWTRMSGAKVWSQPGLATIWKAQAVKVDQAFARAAGERALKEMGGHAPFSAVTASFSRPGVRIVASVGLGAGLCDDGPNDVGSTQIHSVCPMRVAVTRGAVTKTLTVEKACFLDVAGDPADGGPSPRDNGDFAYLDPAGTRLTVETIRDGAPIEECTKTIDVGAL